MHYLLPTMMFQEYNLSRVTCTCAVIIPLPYIYPFQPHSPTNHTPIQHTIRTPTTTPALTLSNSSNPNDIMGTIHVEPNPVCHVVAMPYPGRGHVNPMMNLCSMLATRKPDIIVSFVVTEEWHGFIKSESRPNNVRFETIPNVIPSELDRAKDFPGFMKAVSTKMEAPFAELLDRLYPPVTAIIADTKLVWSIGVGNRKNIPVASLWPMSATVYSLLYHFDMLKEKGHFPIEISGTNISLTYKLFLFLV